MLIDPKSGVPIFRQIADQLRGAIESGVYRPGEMLPSLRALAIDIKVNPNTVQRGYDALEREGIVETRRGVGYFVASFDVGKRSRDERKLVRQMYEVVDKAERSGLSVDAIRLAFDEAMRRLVKEAKK